MTARRSTWPWRLAGVAGAAVAVLIAAFGAIPGLSACGTPGDPILAFELIAKPDHAAALFPASCRSAALAAQGTALALDSLAFIPAYGLFLMLALHALRANQGPLVRRGIALASALVIAAMAADWWENSRLALIIQDFPGTERLVGQLYPAVRLKFLLLGLVTCFAGLLHVRERGLRGLAGSAVALGGGWAAVTTFVAPIGLATANALGWGALIVLSLILAVRPPRPRAKG